MKAVRLESDVRLIAATALLGMIPASLRALSLELSDKSVRLRSIFDQTASGSDIELLRATGAKILADYNATNILQEDYWIISQGSHMTHRKRLIFLRYEPQLIATISRT